MSGTAGAKRLTSLLVVLALAMASQALAPIHVQASDAPGPIWTGTVTLEGSGTSTSDGSYLAPGTATWSYEYVIIVPASGEPQVTGSFHRTSQWTSGDCWSTSDFESTTARLESVYPFRLTHDSTGAFDWLLYPPVVRWPGTGTSDDCGSDPPWTMEYDEYSEPGGGNLPREDFALRIDLGTNEPPIDRTKTIVSNGPTDPGVTYEETATYTYDNISWESSSNDADLDGILDSKDNCPTDRNADQADADADGIGDACDTLEIAWSMKKTTVDKNDNGRIDKYIEGNRSFDVPADGRYPVKLNACGTEATSYSWQFEGPGSLTQMSNTGCRIAAPLQEGDWTVTVTASGPSGATTASKVVKVQNHLIVSLGDSYASGEGNPDKKAIWNRDGTLKRAPVWKHKDCHRSAYAASALAAVELENESPKTSVTFVHLACSGATAEEGLFGRYNGAVKDGNSNPPQLTEAARLANGQPIDSLLVSIGGNDIGFATIIKFCIDRKVSCYEDRTEILGEEGTLHDVSQKLLPRLGARYRELDTCLTTGSCQSPNETVTGSIKVAPEKVILVGYPNLTTGVDGSYCDDYGSLRADEYEWANKVVLSGVANTTVSLTEQEGKQLAVSSDGINPTIRSSSLSYGWIARTAHYDSFDRHGYCADEESWIRSLGQSLKMQLNVKGAFHPNAAGHRNIASLLIAPLRDALGAQL